MTERTDHAKEAWRTWESGIDRAHPDAVDNPAHESLLHMIHALVEQQRIQNLLILLKPEDPRGYDTWPEIAAALGIEEVQS